MAALVIVSGLRAAPRGVVRRLARGASEGLEEDLGRYGRASAGARSRWNLLDDIDFVAAVRASVDDMLDAAVAAWTAGRIARGAARSFPDPLSATPPASESRSGRSP
jgi:hypothetical protein